MANFFFCPPDKFFAFKSSVFSNSKSPISSSILDFLSFSSLISISPTAFKFSKTESGEN